MTVRATIQVSLSLGILVDVEDLDVFGAFVAAMVATDRERLRMGREVLGINANEILACGLLAASGPRTPTEIAEHMRITTASVTELVDRLERDGLVGRARHPTDRRKLLVALTESGQHKAALLQHHYGQVMGRCVAALSEDERAAVLRFLRTTAEVMSSGPDLPNLSLA